MTAQRPSDVEALAEVLEDVDGIALGRSESLALAAAVIAAGYTRTDQGGALGEVESIAKQCARGAHMIGNGAEERRWLDVLAVIERAKAEGTTETPDAATCRHGQPEDGCPSCAACAACDGSCGTCPYATTTGGGR